MRTTTALLLLAGLCAGTGLRAAPSLIASDVDGTLLDDQNRVSPATVETITDAARAGVDLVLATGRPPRWIAQVTDQLAVPEDLVELRPGGSLVRYAVCANGAIIYDVENDRITLRWTKTNKKQRPSYFRVPDVAWVRRRLRKYVRRAPQGPWAARPKLFYVKDTQMAAVAPPRALRRAVATELVETSGLEMAAQALGNSARTVAAHYAAAPSAGAARWADRLCESL